MAMSAITTWWVRMPKNDEFWGVMVLTAIEPIDGKKRHGDRGGDHRVFQDQIIQPVARERCVGTFHGALPFAASDLVIVVLASHWPARSTVLRLLAGWAGFSEKARAGVPRLDGDFLGAAGGGKFLQRIAEHRAGALPGRRRMQIEHVDARIVGKRCET